MQETRISQQSAANVRSLTNFAIQAGAIEMTRQAAYLAVEGGVKLTTVHDTQITKSDAIEPEST